MKTDAQVLKEAQTKPWMFGILVEKYQRPFLRRARRLLRSEALAEDVVQDTFLKIYRHGEKYTFRPGASFSSWAYRILTNTCYDYAARDRAESAKVTTQEFGELDAFASERLSVAEDASLVRSVLLRLPERLSRLLRLYFFEERSYQEIAVIESTTLSAVKSGLHRAKKRFKEVAITLN